MVQSGVKQHARLIKRGALDADRLMNGAQMLQLLGVAAREDHRVLAEQRNVLHVRSPKHVLYVLARELAHSALLLQVEERHLVLGPAQKHACACVEDEVRGGVGRRELLGHLVVQVLDQDLIIWVRFV